MNIVPMVSMLVASVVAGCTITKDMSFLTCDFPCEKFALQSKESAPQGRWFAKFAVRDSAKRTPCDYACCVHAWLWCGCCLHGWWCGGSWAVVAVCGCSALCLQAISVAVCCGVSGLTC